MLKNIPFLTIVGWCFLVFATTVFAVTPQAKPFEHALVFEPNRGQLAPQVQWSARGRGYEMYLTTESLSLILWERTTPASENSPMSSSRLRSIDRWPEARMTTIQMKLRGSRPWRARGFDATGGYSNYFVGSDSKSWRTHIPHYAQLKIAGIYDGIDLILYGHNGELEYDFVLAAGADPQQIRLGFTGAHGMRREAGTGDVVLTTATGAEVRTHSPKVYQEVGNSRIEVPGAYDIVADSEVAFTLASYDMNRPLVIDPTISFTTFISGVGAGNDMDIATGVAVDSAGNSYVTGYTFSALPQTNNALGAIPGKNCTQTVNGLQCPPYAFLTRLSPTGGMLLQTLLGGSAMDLSHAVAVDSDSVYLAGTTFSSNFVPAFDKVNAGGSSDVFVIRLSLLGDQISYAKVFGGSGIDDAYGIAIDSSHAAYVTGLTESTNFVTTNLAMQKQLRGTHDAFVTKLNAYGGFVYSTYLGGSNTDEAAGIAVDNLGYAYVTGFTLSTDFPTVGPVYGHPTGNGTFTAFVTKLVPDGSGVLYSLTLGGGSDNGNAIAAGPTGNAYVTGETNSPAFPTKPGALQINKPSPATLTDAFVAEISPGGLLLYSSYLGGTNGSSSGNSIALNRTGDVYVGGQTGSSDFPGPSPITPNPTAGFLVKLSSILSSLSFRIYLGAQINSIAIPQPTSSRIVIGLPTLTTTDIYVAGFRYTGGLTVHNIDAFASHVSDSPVVAVLAR